MSTDYNELYQKVNKIMGGYTPLKADCGLLCGGEGIRIIPEGFPAMQMVMPVGGFLTLGVVIAGYQWLSRKQRNQKKEAVKG